jgi:hypothetical protein
MMTKEMIFGGLAFLFFFVILDAKAQSAASQQPGAYIATGPDFAGDVPGDDSDQEPDQDWLVRFESVRSLVKKKFS